MWGVWVLLAMLLVLSQAGTLPGTPQPGVSPGGEGDPERPAGGLMRVSIPGRIRSRSPDLLRPFGVVVVVLFRSDFPEPG